MSRPAARDERPLSLLATLRIDVVEFAKVKRGEEAGQAPGGLRSGSWLDILGMPGFWVVVLWRLGNRWHAQGRRPLSRLTYALNMMLFGADLPSGTTVGPGMVIPHPVGVIVASDVVFGARCRLLGHVRIGGSGQPGRIGHPVFGDDVWVMDGARVFGPLTVGDRSVIGASALVTHDVPADTVALAPRAEVTLRPRVRLERVTETAA